jgi:hypothetical protein
MMRAAEARAESTSPEDRGPPYLACFGDAGSSAQTTFPWGRGSTAHLLATADTTPRPRSGLVIGDRFQSAGCIGLASWTEIRTPSVDCETATVKAEPACSTALAASSAVTIAASWVSA